jgi:hypothetical protein
VKYFETPLSLLFFQSSNYFFNISKLHIRQLIEQHAHVYMLFLSQVEYLPALFFYQFALGGQEFSVFFDYGFE